MNSYQVIKNYIKNNKLSMAFYEKIKTIVVKQLKQHGIVVCSCSGTSCGDDFKKSLEQDLNKYNIPYPYREHIYTIIKEQFKCNDLDSCGNQI